MPKKKQKSKYNPVNSYLIAATLIFAVIAIFAIVMDYQDINDIQWLASQLNTCKKEYNNVTNELGWYDQFEMVCVENETVINYTLSYSTDCCQRIKSETLIYSLESNSTILGTFSSQLRINTSRGEALSDGLWFCVQPLTEEWDAITIQGKSIYENKCNPERHTYNRCVRYELIKRNVMDFKIDIS